MQSLRQKNTNQTSVDLQHPSRPIPPYTSTSDKKTHLPTSQANKFVDKDRVPVRYRQRKCTGSGRNWLAQNETLALLACLQYCVFVQTNCTRYFAIEELAYRSFVTSTKSMRASLNSSAVNANSGLMSLSVKNNDHRTQQSNRARGAD